MTKIDHPLQVPDGPTLLMDAFQLLLLLETGLVYHFGPTSLFIQKHGGEFIRAVAYWLEHKLPHLLLHLRHRKHGLHLGVDLVTIGFGVRPGAISATHASACTSGSPASAKVGTGFGISLVLESDIGANFSGLVYRELRDGTGPSRIGFSAVWRGDNENPALQNLMKLLGERYPFGPAAP